MLERFRIRLDFPFQINAHDRTLMVHTAAMYEAFKQVTFDRWERYTVSMITALLQL